MRSPGLFKGLQSELYSWKLIPLAICMKNDSGSWKKHLQENVEESKRLITEVGFRHKVVSIYTSFVGGDEKYRKSGIMQ